MYKQRTAWSDFFPDSPAANLKSQTYTSSQSYSSTNVYVSNCLFIRCTSTDHGGALYCTSTTLLVESSSFFSCTTSNTWGGAIRVSTGQFVLYEVCGYSCYSTYTGVTVGQFACIDVNTASNKNYVNYSSIVRCVNQRSNSYDTVRLGSGEVCCPSVNMSMNKCQYYSGIYTYPNTGSSSVTYSFSYSSFVDNVAYQYSCICFSRGGVKYEMKSCNVLRNTQTSSSNGIIYTYGILDIKNSCILENTATYIFYSSSSSYTITLSDCTVDKTTNNGYLTTQNTVTKSFILGLNHMSTQNCHSEYDSVGILTAIPYVSHTTKKSFCFCYTNKINFCQGRISAFFSIIWMLLFTFIHPNPSGDC
jgi:predicted outer membrane repeat protein